jgi:hypothetical protein
MPGRRFSKVCVLRLANTSACEAPIVFHADLSAAEEIGHGSDRFPRALSAGANGNNEVAKRKFFWGFEDLFVLFHTISPDFSANLVPSGRRFMV